MKKISKRGVWFVITFVALAVLTSCEEVSPSPLLNADTTLESANERLYKVQEEINKIVALKKSCDDSSSCKVIAYGAKACGGPSAYVIYGSGVNEGLLRNKCNEYTRLQDEINKKFRLVSTCDLLKIPEVTCENGMCVAK